MKKEIWWAPGIGGVCGLYLEVNIIHQGQEKRVEVPQEECKDASQLPLQSNAWVIILQGGDGFKQRGTKHSKQGHHNFYLGNQESLDYLCHQYHLLGHHLCTPQGRASPSPSCPLLCVWRCLHNLLCDLAKAPTCLEQSAYIPHIITTL